MAARSRVLLKDWSSGDWSELYLDGAELHRGHSIPDFVWLDLLTQLGCEVTTEEVEDDGS